MNVLQNNLISIVILFILFLGIYRQIDYKDPIYRSFLILICINAMMLLLEIIVYLFSGVNGQFISILITSSAFLFHALIPVILFLTFIFIEFHFNAKPYKIFRYIIPFSMIFIANLVFVILSMSNGYLFIIGEGNIYEIGLFYKVYELAIFGVFLIIFGYAVMQRKKVDRSTFAPLILFIVPLAVTFLLTEFADFVYVTWNAYMISLLIIYIFMQMQITATDYLTGLQNRRGYEYLLYSLNKSKYHEEDIIGIMIDIDNFKAINDEFGHHRGDEALKIISDILKNAVRKNDFVSRTGGDEFAIIIKTTEPNVQEIVIQRIHKQLQAFNQNKASEFNLFVSIGSGIYDREKHFTIANFFEYLDKEMYRDKRISQ